MSNLNTNTGERRASARQQRGLAILLRLLILVLVQQVFPLVSRQQILKATTAVLGTLLAPQIAQAQSYSVSNPTVIATTPESITFSWTTNIPASQIDAWGLSCGNRLSFTKLLITPSGSSYTYTASGLIPGRTYSCLVVARPKIAGTIEDDIWSASPFRVTLPTSYTVSDPTVIAITGTSITFSWTTDLPANRISAWGLSCGSRLNFIELSVTSSGSSYTHTVSGLIPGRTYSCLVVARPKIAGTIEDDIWSASPFRVTLPAVGLTATGGDRRITLNWSYSGNTAGANRWQYKAFEDGTAGIWRDFFPAGDANTRSAVITRADIRGFGFHELINGIRYAINVRLINSSGDSLAESVVENKGWVTTTPSPITLNAAGIDGQAILTWTYSGTISGTTGWQWQAVRPGHDTGWQNFSFSSPTQRRGTTTIPLTNGFQYGVRIRLVDGSGNVFARTTTNNQDWVSVTPTETPLPPAKPTGLKATAYSGRVVLSWNNPGDASITSYRFKQRQGTGSYTNIENSIPSSRYDTVSHTVGGLTNGVSYSFKIIAVNLIGATESDEVTVTPMPRSTTLSAPGLTNNQVTEGNTGTKDVTVTITLSEPAPANFSIAVTLANPGGTAKNSSKSNNPCEAPLNPVDTDYCFPDGAVVTIAEGRTQGTQTIRIIGDARDEEDETINLITQNEDYPSLNVLSLTIKDDDTAGVTVLPNTLSLAEGGSTRSYTVVLNTEPSAMVTIKPGSDDTGAATVSGGPLTFTASDWNIAQTVTVTPVDDNDIRDEEVTVSHTISGYSGVSNEDVDDVTVMIRDSTVPGVRVTPKTLSLIEGGSTKSYTVVLSSNPGAATVTITPDSDDGDAATVSGALTFDSSNWDTVQTVTVTPVDDDDSNDEEVTVSHTISDYTGVSSSDIDDVVVTVDDVGVTISPTRLSLTEGGSAKTYTVVLDTNPSATVTITLSSSDTGATTVSGGPLTFDSSNWDTAQTVTVTPVDDNDSRSEEVTVSHTISGYTGVSSSDIDDVIVTVDDVGVTISPTTLSLTEGESAKTYTVVLNTNPDATVTITPDSDDPGAVTVSDPLTFTASNWDTAQTVTVTPVDDNDVRDEEVTVSHAISGYRGVSNSDIDDVIVTVDDDDTAGVTVTPKTLSLIEGGSTGSYTVVLDTMPSGSVTVTPGSSDTGAAKVSDPLIFSSSDWDTPKTVTVTPVQDADTNIEILAVENTVSGSDSDYDGLKVDHVIVLVKEEGDTANTAGVTVTPTRLSLTEGGSAGSYTVVLDTNPGATVTITLSSSDTGAATVSGGPLVFTASNWDTAQTVAVTPRDDLDGKDETVTVSHTISGYSGVSSENVDDVTVSVDDDDVATTPGVTVTPTRLSLTEGGSTGSYTVALDTNPGATVTITPGSDDGNAVAVSSALIFTASNWDTAQTVTVTPVNDNDVRDEEVTVSHTISGYSGVSNEDLDDVIVTVGDDDTAGVTITPKTLSLTEGGSTGSYTVVLNTIPSGSVTVTPGSSDTDAAIVSAALTFSSSDWDTAKTVTVTPVQDADTNIEILAVENAVSGSDSDYDGLKVDYVVVLVQEEGDTANTAGVTVSPTRLLLTEGGRTGSYTVVLDTNPGATVTITPDSGDDDAATVSSALTFDSSNWNTAQTVTVTPQDDLDAKDETVMVTHTISGYSGVRNSDIQDVTVIIDDDEVFSIPGVSVSPTRLLLTEGGSTGSYTVVLDTNPSATVTVTPDSDDDDAAAVSSALTFDSSNWNTAQTVTVTPQDDLDAKDETVTVSHAISGYTGVSSSDIDDVIVTVDDGDTAGVSVTPKTLSLIEGGTTGSYRVVLDTMPSGSVTVTPGSSDTGAARVSAALTFDASNWNKPKTVTVTPVQDGDTRIELLSVEHAVSGSDADYAGLRVDHVTVLVQEEGDTASSPGVSVSPTRLSLTEGGSTGSYTVVLDTNPSATVTVTPDSDDDDAAAVSSALIFDSSNWNTAQTVTVTPQDDLDAKDETVMVTHTISGYSGVRNSDIQDVTVIIDDDEVATSPGVTISPTRLSLTEGGSTGSYTVVLDTNPSATVTVTPDSDDDDAAAVSSALTFDSSNWNTAQTVTVTPQDDLDAKDETVMVTHTISGYSGVSSEDVDNVIVTVDDDEVATSPGVSISPTRLSLTEGGSTGSYTVVLDTNPSATVTVTPDSDDDAAAVSSALTFDSSNWDTAQTVTVTPVNDNNVRDEEVTVSHTISGYSGVSSEDLDDVIVTVGDDDTAGVTITPKTLSLMEGGSTGSYTVVLDTIPSGSVTVTPGSSDTDAAMVSAALTFSSSDWDTAKTVTITPVQDADTNIEILAVENAVSGSDSDYDGLKVDHVVVLVQEEGDTANTAGVTVSPTRLLLTEGGSTGSYTVVLDTNPSATVTVTPDSDDDAAAVSSALTFDSSNWNTAQTVTVTPQDDLDAKDETVMVTHTISGYSGVSSEDVDDVIVTVDDDEVATSPGVSISPTRLSLTEGGSTGSYTVVLDTNPSATVTVTPDSDDDAAAVSSALTFDSSNWNTAQTVTVTPQDDLDAKDETVTVSHAISGYTGVSSEDIDDVIVTVDDGDTAGVSVTPKTLSLIEGGTTGSYRVVLDTMPSGSVTVTPGSSDTGAARVSAALTFDASNWNKPKTVTVTPVQDGDTRIELLSVEHAVSGSDADYAGLRVDHVTVLVQEEGDTASSPGVSISPTRLLLTEGGSTGSYTVVLDTNPSATVTVTPDSDDDAAAVSSALIFDSSNWNTAQTVTVTPQDDVDAKDETVMVTHIISGYSGVSSEDVDDVIVTVDDDEVATSPGVSISPTRLLLTEGGSTGSYTVVLDTNPSATVTVTPDSDDDAAAVSSALTFDSSNWNTAQTVTVTPQDDLDAKDETVMVTHTISGYSGVSSEDVDNVIVTVDDDEVATSPGVSISPTRLSLTEGGSTGSYTVVLDTNPSATVTVTPDSDDDDAAAVSSALTFDSSNWNTAQTVTVTPQDDVDAKDETVMVTHTISGYSGVRNSDIQDVTVIIDDDEVATSPGVSISPTRLSLTEGGSTGSYTVVLDTNPSATVTVTPDSDDDDAAAVSSALTFDSSNWNTAQTVTVTPQDDVDAKDETVMVTHTISGYSGVRNSDIQDVTVIIDDDEVATSPGVTISPTRLLLTEGGSTGSYTVVLDTNPSATVTVTPDSDDDDAAAVSSALTFDSSNWNTAQTVTVTPQDDVDAKDETVMVTHTISGYSGVRNSDIQDVTVIIDDDEVATSPGVSISPTRLLLTEGGSTGSYTVVLDTNPSATVTVTPDSDDDDAAAVSSALTFDSSNWNTAQTVTVTPQDDVDAKDETVMVTHTISGYSGVRNSDIQDVTVIIDDDEVATSPGVSISPTRLLLTEGGSTGSYTVVLDTNPSATVTVTPDSDDDDAAAVSSALTFDSSNWNTAQTVTVTPQDDLDAKDETVTVSHAISGYTGVSSSDIDDVIVTVDDGDTAGVSVTPKTLSLIEGGTTGSYRVVLDTMPSGSVTVTPGSSDTGAARVSAALTFDASNWNKPKTVTVTPVQDGDTRIELLSVEHAVSGSDADYAGLRVDHVTVLVQEEGDTATSPGVSVSPTRLSLTEGGSTGSYTVVLDTNPSATVTVTPDSDDDDAAAVSSALTFDSSNWNTAQTVTVTPQDDLDAKDETVMVTHTISGYSGVSSEDVDDVIVTVDDDEVATSPGVSVSPTRLSLTEGGSTGSYTVVLDTNPSATVTVTPDSDDDDAAAVSSALTFDSSNWNTAQTVTVTPQDDLDAKDETVMVTHTISGYSGVSSEDVDDVIVTVDDDEVATSPGVSISPTRLLLTEGGSTGSYTVVLDTNPSATVTVTPDSDDDAAAVSSALTFDSSNWNTAQTVTVTPQDDLDAKDETVMVIHAISGYSGVSSEDVDDVIVTVDDDEVATSPGVTISPTRLLLTEGGSTGSYTVVLDTNPSATVTVTPDSDDDDAAAVSSALTFDSSNWNTAQTVTVTPQDDLDAKDETVMVTHTISGYSGVSSEDVDDVIVTVDDDEMSTSPPGVSVTPKTLSLIEGGTTGSYRVVLDTMPSGSVTVTPGSSDTGAARVSAALTFDTSNWNQAQTIIVTAVEDGDTTNESVTVTNTVSSSDYNNLAAEDVMVTVTDDDMDDQQRREDAPQAKARKEELTGMSRAILAIATDMIGTRVGGDLSGSGGGGSMDDQALGILQNLLWSSNGSQLSSDLSLAEIGEQLWSQSFHISQSDSAQQDWQVTGEQQGSWSLWGAGELRSFKGNDDSDAEQLSYSGSVKAAWLGVDYQFTEAWLGGVAVAFSSGESDYSYQSSETGTAGSGSTETRLTAFYPYGSLQLSERLRLWGTVRIGFGELRHRNNDDNSEDGGELKVQLAAIGFDQQLSSIGAWNFSLAGDLGIVKSSTVWEDSAPLEDQSVSITRARLGLNSSFPLSEAITAYLNLKGRMDVGDVEMGAAEMLLGIRYRTGRFSALLQGRQTYAFDGTYSESGILGELRFSSQQDGTGLVLELQPSYGDYGAVGAQQDNSLWNDQQMDALTGQSTLSQQEEHIALKSMIGYGFQLKDSKLLFTPFTRLALTQGSRSLIELGLTMEAPIWEVTLTGSRDETASSPSTGNVKVMFSRQL